MAGVVKSVETATLSMANTESTDTFELTAGKDLDYLVPFVTVSGTSVFEAQYYDVIAQLDAWFTAPGGTETLHVSRSDSAGGCDAEVSVVEFDSTLVNVISDTFQIAGTSDSGTFTLPDSEVVDLSKSFLVFHSTQANSTPWDRTAHFLRGKITSTTQVTIDRGEHGGNGQVDGHYWVVECIGTDFSVTTSDIQMSSTASGNDTTIDVDTSKSWMIGSHKNTGTDGSSNRENTIEATLTSGTRIDIQRASVTSTVDWHGFVIEMNDGTTVQHYDILDDTPLAQTDVTLTTPVSKTRSTATLQGLMGSHTGGSFYEHSGNSAVDSFVQLTLRDSDAGGDFDEVRVTHLNLNSTAPNDISFQVIEWGTGAAGGTRRVMVVG